MNSHEKHNKLANDFIMMAGKETSSSDELMVVLESSILATMLLLIEVYNVRPSTSSALVEMAVQSATERLSISKKASS